MADGREPAVPGQLELSFPPTENEKEQEAIIEAVLFTMGNSVELRQLAVAIGQDQDVARRAVERLIKRYRSSKSGMEITQLEDSYQMCTKAAYYENLIRVAATPKKQVLTEVVLETLSIIAYKQPVTKMEIEKIRGVKSDRRGFGPGPAGCGAGAGGGNQGPGGRGASAEAGSPAGWDGAGDGGGSGGPPP